MDAIRSFFSAGWDFLYYFFIPALEWGQTMYLSRERSEREPRRAESRWSNKEKKRKGKESDTFCSHKC